MSFVSLQTTGGAAPLLVNKRYCEGLTEFNDLSGCTYAVLTVRLSDTAIKKTLLPMAVDEVALMIGIDDNCPGGTIVLNSVATGQSTILLTSDIGMIREIAGGIAIIYHRDKKNEISEYYTDQSFRDVVDMVMTAHSCGNVMVDTGVERKQSIGWLKKISLLK